MYPIAKILLFGLNPETAHFLGMLVIKSIGLLHRWGLWPRPPWAQDPDLVSQSPFGMLDSPLGLAAGFDKNAEALWGWQALGFAFVEIGTVTPQPQTGNIPPRVFRFPTHLGIVNRMGFNNKGALQIAENLRRARSQGLKIKVGGNIGKNRNTPLESAFEDYKKAALYLHPHVDYIVINVSSPNTPGLRDMQSEIHLDKIVEVVRKEVGDKPLFIKVAPDQAEQFRPGVLKMVQKYKLQGVICGNTLANHASSEALSETEVVRLPQGGLSGKPLFENNLRLAKSYLSSSPRPYLIGVGGIMSKENAVKYLSEGCSLVQIYTGFVYSGPGLIKEILKSVLQMRQKPDIKGL